MRNSNKMWMMAVVMVLATAWSVTAFAADGQQCNSWCGFWNSVGGFFYNALPWNWGNWMGK